MGKSIKTPDVGPPQVGTFCPSADDISTGNWLPTTAFVPFSVTFCNPV